MLDWWLENADRIIGPSRFGNWDDPEIAELARINQVYLSRDLDPEVWNEADWQEFERDRLAFEAHHKEIR